MSRIVRAVNRREMLRDLAAVVGGTVLVPVVSACGGATAMTGAAKDATKEVADKAGDAADKAGSAAENTIAAAKGGLPIVAPGGWDPITFNRTRGNAGAIPESYRLSINGPDGDNKHLGKHLPYVPELPEGTVPDGFIAIMWGDPSKGHAKHPNASRNESNHQLGHWYNWIRVRKAVAGDAEELQSTYSDWPKSGEGDSGAYAVFGGDDVTADGGRNTVYLAALPKDVEPGDTVRIYAHCLTHGEYVDFLTV